MDKSLLSLWSLGIFIVWIIVALGSVTFLLLNRDAVLKRKLKNPIVILLTFSFLAYLYFPEQSAIVLWFGIPAALFTSYINIKRIKFCDSCGRTIQTQQLFGSETTCPKCGGLIH